MQNKNAILLFIIAMIVSGCSWHQSDSDNPFQDESTVVNAVTKAKSIDKNKFINYHTINGTNNSKELIAVVFNTDSKINLGFIDEYGNVIKEPFLEAKNYDYNETLRGKVGVDSYFDKYYDYNSYDENGNNIYYDRNFNKVSLSFSEKEEFNRNKSEWLLDTKVIENEEFSAIKECLDKVLKKGFITHDYNIERIGDIYDIHFVYKIGYHILLDEKYELLTPLYFPDKSNLNLFASPNNNSIVGNYFIKDFGLVYYNTYGDIIWITYTK